MMTLMLAPLLKYAEFEGRARRSEYWLFFLFQILVYIPIVIIGIAASGREFDGPSVPFIAAILFFMLPNITVTVRRLHDSDRSGWWYFISLVPLIGGLWLLILTLLDGTSGDNRFGPDPKGGRAYGEVGAFS